MRICHLNNKSQNVHLPVLLRHKIMVYPGLGLNIPEAATGGVL